MHKHQVVISQTVLTCALFIGTLQAQTISYDNTASWDGSGFSSWAGGFTATYGQTFIAPTASTVSLDSYTFYLHEVSTSGNTVTYQAAIYAWDNANDCPTGSALFMQNHTFTDNGTFQGLTVNTGGITLAAGGSYVVYLTTSDPASVTANTGVDLNFEWAYVAASVANDGGGAVVFYNNASYSQLTDGSAWVISLSEPGSFAWKADFNTPVPEPSTLALAGLGLAGLVAGQRKFKK